MKAETQNKIAILFLAGNLVFSANSMAGIDNVTNDQVSPQQMAVIKQANEDNERILAFSKMPEVVGEEILEEEAAGIQQMSPDALNKWGYGRMFPTSPSRAK